MKRAKTTKKYDQRTCYGGDLLKTRRGRARARPLSASDSMHLVLRSSKARGEWSFTRKRNRTEIEAILQRFSKRHEVQVLRSGVVGNHLHLQVKLGHRRKYRANYNAFIRAVSAAIAMAVTGASRWQKLKQEAKDRFWDRRPFTRIVQGVRQYVTLQRYIDLNQLEGFGYTRRWALYVLENDSS